MAIKTLKLILYVMIFYIIIIGILTPIYFLYPENTQVLSILGIIFISSLFGGMVVILLVLLYDVLRQSHLISLLMSRIILIFVIVNITIISIMIFFVIYPNYILIDENLLFPTLGIILVIINGTLAIILGYLKVNESKKKNELINCF